MTVQCCSRDNDHDGNCDIHSAPGVMREPPRYARHGVRPELPLYALPIRVGDSVHDVMWRQGTTLVTPQTREWTPAQWKDNQAKEQLLVFAHFRNDDEGRGRVQVAAFVTPLAAAHAVRVHNAYIMDQFRRRCSASAVFFAREVLGIELTDGQKAILRALGRPTFEP